MVEKSALVERLNAALEMEYGTIIQNWQHAQFVKGINAEPIIERLEELAGDEIEHARKLRERITALGGIPSVRVAPIQQSTNLQEILEISLGEEEKAYEDYCEIIGMIKENRDLIVDHLLMHVLYDIVAEEQQHVEELGRLLGR